jgi:hypothetical protein
LSKTSHVSRLPVVLSRWAFCLASLSLGEVIQTSRDCCFSFSKSLHLEIC